MIPRPRVLFGFLGAFEFLLALGSSPASRGAVGAIGGCALAATPWLVSRSRAVATVLLALGTLPFAVLTWWSLVSPVLALLALALGLALITSRDRLRPSLSPDVRGVEPW